jgi:hypothetical protein
VEIDDLVPARHGRFLLGFVLTEVHLERFADALNSAGQDPDRTTVRHGTLRSTSARP